MWGARAEISFDANAISASVVPDEIPHVRTDERRTIQIVGTPGFSEVGELVGRIEVEACLEDRDPCPTPSVIAEERELVWTIRAPSELDVPDTLAAPTPERVVRRGGTRSARDEVWVLAEPGLTDSGVDGLARRAASTSGGVVLGSLPELGIVQVAFPGASEEERDRHKATLEKMPGVARVINHWLPRVMTANLPDEYDADTWDSDLPGGEEWNLEMIRADDAWDTRSEAPAVSVTVIDHEIYGAHRDLADSVTETTTVRLPAIDDRGFPKIGERTDGHGTSVAGLACATGDNGFGISGTAWGCDLRGLNLLSDVPGDQELVDFIHAMTLAAAGPGSTDAPAVVNVSLAVGRGGNDCDHEPTDEERRQWGELASPIYRVMSDPDVLWVVGAGNSCRNSSYTNPLPSTLTLPRRGLGRLTPACGEEWCPGLRNVAMVAAVNSDDSLATYSSFGRPVQLAAPGGVDVASGDGIAAPYPYRTCGFLWWESLCMDAEAFTGDFGGTSAAAPHVAGLAALVMAEHPELDAAEVRTCIVAGARMAGRRASVPTHLPAGWQSAAERSDLTHTYVIDMAEALRCPEGVVGAYEIPVGRVCGSAPGVPLLPAGSSCVSAVDADLDGDELRDRLVLYFGKESDSIQHARAFLATGEISDAHLEGTSAPSMRAPEEVVDLDLDGGDEVVVTADNGANTLLQSVVSWDGDRLVQVEATGGTLGDARVTAPLIDGGGVSHMASWGCLDEDGDGTPEIIQSGFQGSFEYPRQYSWFETVYGWKGKTLVMVAERSGVGNGPWPQTYEDVWGYDIGRCGDDPPPAVEPLPPEPTTPLAAARGLLDAWSLHDERLASAFTGVSRFGSVFAPTEDPIRGLFRFDAHDYDPDSLECRMTGASRTLVGDRVKTAFCSVSPIGSGQGLFFVLEASGGGHHGFASDSARPWWAITSVALDFGGE